MYVWPQRQSWRPLVCLLCIFFAFVVLLWQLKKCKVPTADIVHIYCALIHSILQNASAVFAGLPKYFACFAVVSSKAKLLWPPYTSTQVINFLFFPSSSTLLGYSYLTIYNVKVTRPSFCVGGYHPTLKLSGIPTFTFIVSLTHRMDNI